jgi:dimeric dUTPase (all-alpha-NTP-PPase superfamily)
LFNFNVNFPEAFGRLFRDFPDYFNSLSRDSICTLFVFGVPLSQRKWMPGKRANLT